MDIYTDIINGSPGGSGAWNDPLQTIQQGIDVGNGGDTLWVGDSGVNTLTAQLNWDLFGQTQEVSVDARFAIRGWSFAGGAGAAGLAVIDGNGLPGILASLKQFITWHGVEIYGTDGLSHNALDTEATNHINECYVHDITGANSYAIYARSGVHVRNCRVGNVVRGIYGGLVGGSVVDCVVQNNSDRGIQVNSTTHVARNVVISGGGTALYVANKNWVIDQNTIVGDGTTPSIYGIDVLAAADGGSITRNMITGWSGAGNVGLRNAAGNKLTTVGYNYFSGNTLDESALLADDCDVYFESVGPGPGLIVGAVASNGGSSAPTAEENATATLEKLLADHSAISGSLAERLTRIPNVNPATSGGLGTVDANNRIAGIAGSIVNTLDQLAGPGFTSAFALDQMATLGEQYDEIKKLFDTEQWAELGSIPTATPTTIQAIMLAYMMSRNLLTDDRINNKQTIHDDANNPIGEADRDDDGNVFTRNKFGSVS